MAKLREIVEYLDAELRTSEMKDYPGAMNGLQLENNGTVSRIWSAVDASLAVIKEAALGGGGLLLVHHGMFWQGVRPLTGAHFMKIKMAMDANLAIYSSHLPLDVHPEIGNNVLLAEALGLEKVEPILMKDARPMGVRGVWEGSRCEFVKKIASAVGREVRVCPGGNDRISNVAVITGGAGSEIRKVSETGVDSFVTGEGQHWTFVEGEESGMNVFYAGHYATETFGVRRLGEMTAKRTGCEFLFIDRPGGL